MEPTKYQRTHYPISKRPVPCASQKPLNRLGTGSRDGFCPDCGRYLSRRTQEHLPNLRGAFGWIERYADGSFLVIPGEHPMPWCRVCEQTNVPAVHRTPLGEECYGPVFGRR